MKKTFLYISLHSINNLSCMSLGNSLLGLGITWEGVHLLKRRLGVLCWALDLRKRWVLYFIEKRWVLYFIDIILECDSETMVHVINNHQTGEEGMASIFREIRRLMNVFRRVTMKHVYKESNVYADWLAN